MNMMGLMAKFDTMLPSFLKELKDLVAHEGGKWEWLRHSYFHIPSYVRDDISFSPHPFCVTVYKSHANVTSL